LHALLRDEHAIGHITGATLLVPSLHCARKLNALDSACEELCNLGTAAFLDNSAPFTFTSSATATSSIGTSTTPIAIAILATTIGGASRGDGNEIFIASTGITSASCGGPIFILVFSLALGYSVNVCTRPETPIRVSRAMIGLRLDGSLLPQLALGGRERLPDDSDDFRESTVVTLDVSGYAL
jgi:hypothetical protein